MKFRYGSRSSRLISAMSAILSLMRRKVKMILRECSFFRHVNIHKHQLISINGIYLHGEKVSGVYVIYITGR